MMIYVIFLQSGLLKNAIIKEKMEVAISMARILKIYMIWEMWKTAHIDREFFRIIDKYNKN